MGLVTPYGNKVEREREREIYLSVVTGTHYGTKTPPDQQPTNPNAGGMSEIYMLQALPGWLGVCGNKVSSCPYSHLSPDLCLSFSGFCGHLLRTK